MCTAFTEISDQAKVREKSDNFTTRQGRINFWGNSGKSQGTFLLVIPINRMAWQWAETLVETMGTLADIRGTTKLGCSWNFPKHEFNRPVCLEAHHYLLAICSSGFHHICNIKCRLDCRYSPQNIFNAKNFNPHNKPTSLLNVLICTQGMQRTWWPEAGTIIVTGPYCHRHRRWL